MPLNRQTLGSTLSKVSIIWTRNIMNLPKAYFTLLIRQGSYWNDSFFWASCRHYLFIILDTFDFYLSDQKNKMKDDLTDNVKKLKPGSYQSSRAGLAITDIQENSHVIPSNEDTLSNIFIKNIPHENLICQIMVKSCYPYINKYQKESLTIR